MRTDQGRHATDDDLLHDEERAEQAAAAHRRIVRRILQAERDSRLQGGPKQGPKPLEKPRRADDVLAKLAARHKPGEALGLVQIAAAGGCSTGSALAIRRWAISKKLWPYAQSKGGFPARRAGGEP